jgi:DNA (cytosine-5)-methyltransferase 1
MTFIDFFAGIGGFRLGMEAAGHRCVGFVEKDKFAVRSYRAMFNTEGEYFEGDITSINPDELPEAECYCFGFPCQSFSINGQRRGFDDRRGNLFSEVMRLAGVRKPRYLFAENVTGLLSHDKGRTFATIICTMDKLGYDAQWQVCDSADWIPQHRERVYIVGTLRGERTAQIFPIVHECRAPDELQGQCTNTITRQYKSSNCVGSYIVTGKQQEADKADKQTKTPKRESLRHGGLSSDTAQDGRGQCDAKDSGGGAHSLFNSS